MVTGRSLVTLEDAANHIQRLPEAEQLLPGWQTAIEALILVVELNGPTMMARIGDQTAIGRHMARVGSAPGLAKSSDNYHLQSLVGCSRSQVVVYGGFLPDINWCHVRSRLPDTWANVLRHRCTADMVAIPCDGPPIPTDVEAMERDGIIVRRGRQRYSVPVLRPGGTKDNAILLCDLYRLTPKGVALCEAHGITALESSA